MVALFCSKCISKREKTSSQVTMDKDLFVQKEGLSLQVQKQNRGKGAVPTRDIAHIYSPKCLLFSLKLIRNKYST